MHTIGRDDTGTSSAALALCSTPAILRSMTPTQIAVLKQLASLQLEAGGVHSLLPNVMQALLALARRPWWDRAVAGLPDEPDPRLPDPPVRAAHAREREGDPAIAAAVARSIALNLFLRQADTLSMTPAQHRVFDRLCTLQVADAGPAALLPQTLAALLGLARRPWWDRDMAAIVDEDEPQPGLPA